jgi:hypothetical protein
MKRWLAARTRRVLHFSEMREKRAANDSNPSAPFHFRRRNLLFSRAMYRAEKLKNEKHPQWAVFRFSRISHSKRRRGGFSGQRLGQLHEPIRAPQQAGPPAIIGRSEIQQRRTKRAVMEKELIDRAEAIRQRIVQLRDSL